MHATLDIDAIVREVLQRLAQIEVAAAPGHKADGGGRKAEGGGRKADANAADGVLLVREHVVSVAQIEGKLTDVERVKVSPRAVVTPAVRDLLREKNIKLELTSAGLSRTKATRLVVGMAETAFHPAPVLRKLDSVQTELLARTGLATVVAELADEVRKSGSLGLLLTSQPQAALCAANRFAGVRAAWADCVSGVEKAKQTIGVNLLIVDPQGKSATELEPMLTAFCSGGPTACPAALRNLLS